MILGNSIMLKHSPSTPLCAEALEGAFKEAGFGKGEFQNLFVDHRQCEKIISDRRVRAVKFTGSTEAGCNIAASCGKHMKKGCFELGGNDPFIVLKDANMEQAVETAYKSRMSNSGQACINAKRFIITSKVYDEFRDRLLEKINDSVKIGDPMDPEVNCGPLALEKQVDKLKSQINRAMKEGGATITRGDLDFKIDHPEMSYGNFTDTFMLEGMSPESSIYKEEFFGPVFSLFKVNSSKEALDLANKSDFGLASTIFTEDLDKAERASHRLRTGTVFINDCVTSSSEFPSGGIKGSGFGRECYSDGILDISNRKTIISRKE